jgi:hypothetical protein
LVVGRSEAQRVGGLLGQRFELFGDLGGHGLVFGGRVVEQRSSVSTGEIVASLIHNLSACGIIRYELR